MSKMSYHTLVLTQNKLTDSKKSAGKLKVFAKSAIVTWPLSCKVSLISSAVRSR